jgi:hypothetical protein
MPDCRFLSTIGQGPTEPRAEPLQVPHRRDPGPRSNDGPRRRASWCSFPPRRRRQCRRSIPRTELRGARFFSTTGGKAVSSTAGNRTRAFETSSLRSDASSPHVIKKRTPYHFPKLGPLCNWLGLIPLANRIGGLLAAFIAGLLKGRSHNSELGRGFVRFELVKGAPSKTGDEATDPHAGEPSSSWPHG